MSTLSTIEARSATAAVISLGLPSSGATALQWMPLQLCWVAMFLVREAGSLAEFP
ncbi:MAG: hypothetical protein WCY88_12345 [Spongiibacteraceae bacterium]